MPTSAGLASHRYLSLATFRRSGAEVRTPVWFAEDDGRLYVLSAGAAGKIKRLRHSARARVAPCDVRGGVRGPWRDATARLVTDPATIERAHAALRAKYGRQMWLADVLARLTGRLAQRAWVEIEVDSTIRVT
jgi:uncharacterized protein